MTVSQLKADVDTLMGTVSTSAVFATLLETTLEELSSHISAVNSALLTRVIEGAHPAGQRHLGLKGFRRIDRIQWRSGANYYEVKFVAKLDDNKDISYVSDVPQLAYPEGEGIGLWPVPSSSGFYLVEFVRTLGLPEDAGDDLDIPDTLLVAVRYGVAHKFFMRHDKPGNKLRSFALEKEKAFGALRSLAADGSALFVDATPGTEPVL